LSFIEKIEKLPKHVIRISDMASLTNYTNDSYESDCDSVYSDTSLDDVEVLGDRDYDDEEPLQTEASKRDDEKTGGGRYV
jgi:hypothetical protein